MIQVVSLTSLPELTLVIFLDFLIDFFFQFHHLTLDLLEIRFHNLFLWNYHDFIIWVNLSLPESIQYVVVSMFIKKISF